MRPQGAAACLGLSKQQTTFTALLRMACWQVVAGGSFMNFRNDMALGGNLATQFAATPETQARLPHLLALAACSDVAHARTCLQDALPPWPAFCVVFQSCALG